jgi:hypothetical protein
MSLLSYRRNANDSMVYETNLWIHRIIFNDVYTMVTPNQCSYMGYYYGVLGKAICVHMFDVCLYFLDII